MAKKFNFVESPDSQDIENEMSNVQSTLISQPSPTTGIYKNVGTRIPIEVYNSLNQLKLFSQERITIGDLAARAIIEFVERETAKK